jgi:hypothetical protein
MQVAGEYFGNNCSIIGLGMPMDRNRSGCDVSSSAALLSFTIKVLTVSFDLLLTFEPDILANLGTRLSSSSEPQNRLDYPRRPSYLLCTSTRERQLPRKATTAAAIGATEGSLRQSWLHFRLRDILRVAPQRGHDEEKRKADREAEPHRRAVANWRTATGARKSGYAIAAHAPPPEPTNLSTVLDAPS